MPTFIVERYVPVSGHRDFHDLATRAKRAATLMDHDGSTVRYLRSTLLPGDETCFCLFDAPTAELVREANERAGLPFHRIVEARTVSAGDLP
jgi:hypothetical protein